MKQSYSLYELNEYIRRVMALNFAEPIWINCEIAQIKESRGNFYLELVEQNDSNEIKAQISGVIWYRSFLFFKNKLGELTNSLLKAGTHIQIKAQVDFNERYGLKLVIEDIDPSYTLGQLELNRQKILSRLKDENILHLNKSIVLPKVLQKVAIISSQTAAGYADFINQCKENPYGYDYKLTLFQSALQGQNTEREVCQALEEINSRTQEFDLIVIIRGGGSKLDLSFFDNFNIGYKIATSTLPVVTGIGHEIDQSIADIASHLSLKTPTAVADFIIEHNANFEGEVINNLNAIVNRSKQVLKANELLIHSLIHQIKTAPKHKINDALINIDFGMKNIDQRISYIFQSQKDNLQSMGMLIHAHDPIHIFKKGFVTISQNGSYVESSSALKNDEFEINFLDGKRTAKPTDRNK